MHFVEAIEMNPRSTAIQEFLALADGKLSSGVNLQFEKFCIFVSVRTQEMSFGESSHRNPEIITVLCTDKRSEFTAVFKIVLGRLPVRVILGGITTQG